MSQERLAFEHRLDLHERLDAYTITRALEIFEAIDRRHGFTVRAPRIPGLRYRDLDEID